MDGLELVFDAIEDLDKRLQFIPLLKLGINGQGITIALLDSGVSSHYQAPVPIIENIDFTNEHDAKNHILAHGTQMAVSIHTIAPGATIANLKVIPYRSNPNRQTIQRAIDFCIEHYPKIRIINLSVWFEPAGCTESKCSLCNKVDEAVESGLVVVIASGNLGPKVAATCPALARKALSCAAIWSKEIGEWWENLSRVKKWWWEISGKFGERFGTSFSAAYTSGCIALLLSGIPQATPDSIDKAIKATALNFNSAALAYPYPGQLNCYAAYQFLQKYLTKFGQ